MNDSSRIDMSGAPKVDLARSTWDAGFRSGAVLSIEGVRQSYGRVTALDGVSFDLERGKVLALVGHSGSGKSTLLRVAAGLERPNSGRVLIEGAEMSGPGRFVLPEERGVGLMFQDYALFPHMTVLQNVAFGLAKLSRADAGRIARGALENVGLAHRAGDYPHMLSGGEQQRIALARAIAPGPNVLLMDEPFSNLDRRTRDIVRDETIGLIRKTGTTAVLVTHDPEEAMRLADSIVLLRRGQVVQSGTAEDLYRRPESLFVARFFCEFDELEGTVKGGRADTALGVFPAEKFADGARATICIRPNAIRLARSGPATIGKVLSRRFLGDVDLLHIAVNGVPRALHARVPAGTAFNEGDRVGVEIAPDEVMVFAETDPRPESRS